MVEMGAEVGHKMRSAIKAKLTELDCYVDDELPDYIMVMVANKRTKSQMNEDLNLFLNAKTSTFVDWLHIVLKKLKEVTVTNLEVYKKASKRKSSELSSIKVKKEKRIKKEKILKLDEHNTVKQEKEEVISKSLTDDLPFNVKSLSESRKILVVSNIPTEKKIAKELDKTSEVDQSNLKELKEIENQIKSVKNRLGLKVDDDVEEAELRRLVENSRNKSKEQLPNIPSSNYEEKFLSNGRHIELDTSKTIQVLPEEEHSAETNVVDPTDWGQKNVNEEDCSMKKEHSRIIFSKNDLLCTPNSPPKKKSVRDRLGKFSDNKEKSVLDRLGKQSENNKWKNLNEICNDSEDSYKTESSSEIKRNQSNIIEDYYSGKIEKHYLQGRVDDNSDTKGRNSRKEQFVKRDVDKFKRMDSSFRKSRDDLRKYLLKNEPSYSLRKDLKKRLGLSSKITVPQIDPQLLEDTFKKREVVSVVKVKPRILPPNMQQANKNLLLKAVADAQKSVAQSKPVGENLKNSSSEVYNKIEELEIPSNALYTKQYKLNRREGKIKKISLKEKEKLKCLLSTHGSVCRRFTELKDGNQEYIPEPIKHNLSNVEYIPSIVTNKKDEVSANLIENQHQFIVTLDGIQKNTVGKISVKERLHGRKTPSPIIFEESTSSSIQFNASPKEDISKIPDKLKLVSPPIANVKEKCKYFPLCRNGTDCEFYHPNKNCEQFPYCKFGEECLYLHPSCKFGTSCTRRGCPYSHSTYLKQAPRSVAPIVPAKLQAQSLQICKFFPNCVNINCSFYHPKPCKFGKYCKNQSVCNYTHSTVPNKSSLSWKSK